MSRYRLNSCFDPQEFLNKYWQQQPVLLPALFPDFEDALTAAELAGLACEEFIESRLIRTAAAGSWKLEPGPFVEATFQQLPARDWTLLVQAVDQWSETVAALKPLFDFIPSWRIDDVMVSYAVTGGGVGPHFDFYDVFLLQGSGQRRWLVGDRCAADAALLANSELKILANFETRHEFLLHPGDVLYLPPQTAHWGVAVSAGLCYSIGFRAPAVAEMLEAYSDALIAGADPAQRFTDASDRLPIRPGAINPASLVEALTAVVALVKDGDSFGKWFGTYVTEPKYPELVQPLAGELELSALLAQLNAGASLRRFPGSRFAFLELESGLVFFADGDPYEMAAGSVKAISMLCDLTPLNSTELSTILQTDSMPELILRLVNQGSLVLE